MSSFYSHRFECHGPVHPRDVLLVFLADDELKPDKLSALVDIAVERDLAPDEMIMVVRNNARLSVAKAIAGGDELNGMRARLTPHTTITVVGFGSDGKETSRQVAFGKSDASSTTLEEVGRRAVTAIFQERGGFVEANAKYHFRNPSGRHTDRFMRLSNLLVSSAEISIIAMTALWLVPHDAVEIHVDTPAMFSIVAAMNEHLRSLAPKRPALRCESFRSYFGADQYDFTSSGPSAVLISASSSGSLARRIVKRSYAAERIGHVLFLGEDHGNVRFAIDLAFDAEANPQGISENRETFMEGSCRLCNDGSVAVPLLGDQFDMGGPEFEPLTINKDDAPKGLSETMTRLARSGALTISLRTGAARRQHFVDTEKLVTWKPFLERLAYFARRHIPSAVKECVLLDEASRNFAERLMSQAGVTPSMVPRDHVDSLQRDDSTTDDVRLDGCPIVIVAPVIESGRSLRDVSRELRHARPNSPQIYLIGVVKIPTAARLEELERTLIQTKGATPHAFAVIEQILLPPSDAPNAWAAELGFLELLVTKRINLSTDLQNRLSTLKRASSPLRDDLFVANGGQPLVLQPGFVFWPASLPDAHNPRATQADVYYTISSVLQRLRTNPPKPGVRALRENWFQQTRLDPANLGRFNDGVIQASLLRAARPTEIDYSENDAIAAHAGRVVRRIVEASHLPRGEAASEMLIALGSKRLRLPRSELAEVLRPRTSHPPLVDELVKACCAVLL